MLDTYQREMDVEENTTVDRKWADSRTPSSTTHGTFS